MCSLHANVDPLSADRGAEFVPAREWMRICFELLDLLKAHKKGIRRAAVNTFGYIAKTLGPQDVLSVLLTNLRVQERQSRVCSTVAIGTFYFILKQDVRLTTIQRSWRRHVDLSRAFLQSSMNIGRAN